MFTIRFRRILKSFSTRSDDLSSKIAVQKLVSLYYTPIRQNDLDSLALDFPSSHPMMSD